MAYGRAINCIFQGLAYDDVICLDRGLGKSPLPTGIGKHTPPFSFGRTELRSSHTITRSFTPPAEVQRAKEKVQRIVTLHLALFTLHFLSREKWSYCLQGIRSSWSHTAYLLCIYLGTGTSCLPVAPFLSALRDRLPGARIARGLRTPFLPSVSPKPSCFAW